ncbi:hypothetical protein AYK61_21675 [Rhodococcus sp. SBT000017]|nr:hypothetical protein AYK61_21675 [Rhodococcus sp. SBT000017]
MAHRVEEWCGAVLGSDLQSGGRSRCQFRRNRSGHRGGAISDRRATGAAERKPVHRPDLGSGPVQIGLETSETSCGCSRRDVCYPPSCLTPNLNHKPRSGQLGAALIE